jgi:flagellin
MALTVATNTGALMAQAAASSVNKDMELSMERLATGKRINGASDDAAGVAIASRLTAEIKGTNQAIRNAMDAQSLIDTAEGAHSEVENILQRMRELAVQSSNDTLDSNDRTNLQIEIDQLVSEINRISSVTTWGGVNLIDGTYSGTGLNFHVGAGNTSNVDNLTVTIGSMSAGSLSVSGSGTAPTITDPSSAYATSASGAVMTATNSAGTITFRTGGDITGVYTVVLDGQTITVTGISATDSYADNVTGLADKMKAAIEANAALVAAGVTVSTSGGTVTLGRSGGISISSVANASTAITTLDTAIQTVNAQRAKLGSVSNRLDSTVSNLTNISSNLSAGKGRIEDADFAAETTSLAKSQILQQASTAMLAQANASKQNVLSLLQG